MCGISGILNFSREPVDKNDLIRMNESLSHRGPDGDDVFLDDYLGFGHRRLAVIDLSDAAKQPMFDESGRYAITYNGEIYNFQDIRGQLEELGHVFVSHTDTEVVLKSLIQWGPDAVTKFNGMFAFAFWDRSAKELILARDRYGIKPFYYHVNDESLVFGSEIKALIASGKYIPKIDSSDLLEYLTFQNLFRSKSLFKDVHLLEPGTYMRFSLNGFMSQSRYWDFDFSEDLSMTEDQAIELFQEMFSKSISRQLISDVPLGAYLSGGIDSGLINFYAAREVDLLRSYTVGFDMNSVSGIELTFDERAKAEYLSYLAKTEHYEMILKAGDMERCIKDLVWHLEEPRIGQSYPNYYASKLASSFGKVVLSGTGGDEIFAGYPWRYYKGDHVSPTNYVDSYYDYWQRLLEPEEFISICKPMSAEFNSFSSRDAFEDVFLESQASPQNSSECVNRALYFEAKTFLHSLLVVEDKLSMAHSLESRVPFLDNDLVDVFTKVPLSLKLRKFDHDFRLNENTPGPKNSRYFEVEKDGKMLLRKVFSREVNDDAFLVNAKQGFSAPDAAWFKGESIDYVKSIIENSQSPIFMYLDQQSVKNIFSQHASGVKNRRLFVWSVIYLNNFLETFF